MRKNCNQIIRNAAANRRDDLQRKKLELLEAKAEHELAVQRYAEREFRYSPLAEVPDDVKLTNDYFESVRNRVEYNNFYADYYMQRYSDTNLQKFADISQRVRDCHKSWFGDKYKESGYFNVKRVFHCHNRWCWLCNHLKQAQRLGEYHVKLEQLTKVYDVYHVVFTVPNVTGDVLKSTLLQMQSSLKKLIRYFQERGNGIAGVDFAQYGFVGAIRSFEIVILPTEYHPHLHCLFLMKKGLNFPQTEINKYSFNYGSSVPTRLFSKFEIMLQKIFYLLMNGKKLTLKNIESLPFGYSCTADCVEGESWHEVFKYATKMSKDGASVCTYEQFVLLDDIFHRFKMIQGYGIFYNDKTKSDDDIDPTAEILFEKVLILLNSKEKPERDISMALDKIVDEVHKKQLTVISKKLSYKYLKTLMDNVKAELNIGNDYFEPF